MALTTSIMNGASKAASGRGSTGKHLIAKGGADECHNTMGDV